MAVHYLWPTSLEITAEVYDQVAAKPKPVPVGRYRYSKLRWRVLVHALDAAGGMAIAVLARLRSGSGVGSNPGRILVIQLDHLGDAVLTAP